MLLLVVNFHYVAERVPDAPRAIFPVSTDALGRSVEELGRSFEFVSRDDLLAAVEGRRPLPPRSCLVTFDDGLRAQVELALPVLERLGIPAVFFVCGRPLAERRVLDVHKLHHLRERLSDDEFERAVRATVDADRIESISDAAAAAAYRYDAASVARMKYLVNVAMSPVEREQFVDGLFASFFEDEAAFSRSLYISAEQLRALERKHRAVGAHGYSHRALAPLDAVEVDRDLTLGREVISEVTGVAPRTISYPHGSLDTVNAAVAASAKRAGYVAGFTMERAFNRSLEAPLVLARLDANDVPGGKRPLFELVGDEIVVGAGMSPARRDHLREAA